MNKDFIHPVHNCYDGYFNTNSLMRVDLANPDPFMIRLGDIVHALSNLCRFGGHSEYFYSVLQHSILVASIAPREIRKEALLHDATEAYVGDVIKPLKVMLGDVYETIEDKFMQAIIEAFDLDPAHLLAVKYYDKVALEMEHEALIKNVPRKLIDQMFSCDLISPHAPVGSLDPDFFTPSYCWTPQQSRNAFIKHFSHLF